ncbi:inositol polyphosphate multikinase-like [Uloborus diversus]|uniref:inositol polyphosphate multikinase-like n=1 Tax=Uloborus diversus TaxID=327109 RepID=UPI00240A62AF|nr:inositol polyphosphate multikinase-like [Uloborus diversus]
MDQNNDKNTSMPPETTLFDFQIGGHKHGEGRDKWGVLKHQNGNILKPLRKGDSRSVKELEFYENVFEKKRFDPIMQELSHFLPAFCGTWETSVNGSEMRYLCLEDVCSSYQKPCVFEAKIGSQTYAPDATEAKINIELSKSPGGILMGFRVIGMKVYDDCKNEYLTWDKYYGRSLMPDTVLTALENFFRSQCVSINCWILSSFVHKLLLLQEWFMKQRSIAFYGSSLLFVYEGKLSSWQEWAAKQDLNVDNFTGIDGETFLESKTMQLPKQNNCECGLTRNICMKLSDCSLFKVKMIDFAHTFSTSEIDSNYIDGLQNLTDKLKELMELYKTRL